jgi:aminoglycoside 3-N-acetyltransferase
MRELTLPGFVDTLRELGVQTGDGLLIHSAVHFLGKPRGGVAMYYNGLCNVLDGQNSPTSQDKISDPASITLIMGTIAVPTFTFGFCSGNRYDPKSTPAIGMGAFSEFIRMLPAARRTFHPMQSIAIIGKDADDLALRDTLSAFDPGSAFERILELDYKLLLLGADIQAVSMLHYNEQRAEVPYRCWKDFSGEVQTPDGWQTKTYRMYVRDLDIDPQIELFPVQQLLEETGQWRSLPMNYGHVSLCKLIDFVSAVDHFLEKDPWSLVTNPPKYI